jgi:O-antigen ligase
MPDALSSSHSERGSRRSSLQSHGDRDGRAQLWALFALIIYAPLPLASDRPWALAVLGIASGFMLLWNTWSPVGRGAYQVWELARVPLVLMVLWLLLILFQISPFSETWLGWQDPGKLYVNTGMVTVDLYSTRLYLFKAMMLMSVFWLVLVHIDTRPRIESFAIVIVFSGLLQAMIGVILMATGATFDLFFVHMVDPFAHGTFVYHNHLAGYLELCLATGIGLMIAKLDGGTSANWRQMLHGWLSLLFSEKVMLRVSLIIMVIGLVATRSRMGNSAFFASLLITGLVTVTLSKYVTRNLVEQRAKELMRSTVLFITSLIILDVVIIGGVVGIEKVVHRIGNTNLETRAVQTQAIDYAHIQLTSEESIEQRSKAARSAAQIVRDFPVLGTGGGTFHLSFLRYQPAEIQSFYDHAHNDYVELTTEVGISGALILLFIVFDSLRTSLLLLLRRQEQLIRGLAFASLMGVISLLIHATVDFNFQNPSNAMLFLILLSFPYLLSKLGSRSKKSDVRVSKFRV